MAFLSLPMQSGIRFNFKRLNLNLRKIFTLKNIIPLGLGILSAWFVILSFISMGANLDVFRDFYTTMSTVSVTGLITKEVLGELLVYCAGVSGASDGSMPGLGEGNNAGGKNPGGNPGGNNPGGNNPWGSPGAKPGALNVTNSWGDPNQPAAGPDTRTLQVNDPLGQLNVGYDAKLGATNQPYARNLADALEHQFAQVKHPLSKYTLDKKQWNFLKGYLDTNVPHKHDEIWG